MKVELLSYTKNPIETIAEAASVCYDSKPSVKIVKHCIKSGHNSIIEFANFAFKISGIDRATANQLVRHRIASYEQQSQRYCSLDNFEYNEPPTINGSKEAHRCFENVIEAAKDSYSNLIELGIKKEDARSILPNCCDTTICVSMNLRSLANFMNLRLCSRAQLPIRQLAIKMRNVLLENPNFSLEDKEIFKMVLVPMCEKNEIHYCPEVKGCGKYPALKELMDKNNL